MSQNNKIYFELFITYIQAEKMLSHNTVTSYVHDINIFLTFFKKPLASIRRKDILLFYEYLSQKKYALSTINKVIISTKQFFRFLKKEDLIQINPFTDFQTKNVKNSIPDVLTSKEIEKLFNQVNLNTLKGKRDRAIMEIIYGCGLRVNEVCDLRIYHLDEMAIKIRGKGNSERILPIGRYALEAIKSYLNTLKKKKRDDLLFPSKKGKKLHRHEIWRIIKYYSRLAKINKNVSPHSLRHTFATHLLDNGADLRIIQDLMGHKNIISTERYVHISRERLKMSFKKHHPRYYGTGIPTKAKKN